MSEEPKKSRFEKKQDVEQESQSRSERTEKVFESPEEMLRFDAAQIVLPGRIEERLKDSLAREPEIRGSWWKRLFGKK